MYGRSTKVKVALVLAALLGTAPVTGCSSVLTTADEAYVTLGSSLVPRVDTGLKRPGVLTVGIRRGASAPFVSQASRKPTGLDVEVGAAIANDMGLPVAFVYADDISEALSHSCDCVMEVDPSEAVNCEVGCAYASSAVAVFGHEGPALLHGGDLAGKTVAVQEGSASEAALDATALTCDKLTVPTIRAAFEALTTDACDYVMGNFVSCAYLASTLPDVSFVGTLTTATNIGIAVTGGTDSVSAEIFASYERLSQNGVLAETCRRWVGDIGLLGPDMQVQDIPMPEVKPEPEVVGNIDGDGTKAGSNAVTVGAMLYYR